MTFELGGMLLATLALGAIWSYRRGPKLLLILAALWALAGLSWLILPMIGGVPDSVVRDLGEKLVETGLALLAFGLGAGLGHIARAKAIAG